MSRVALAATASVNHFLLVESQHANDSKGTAKEGAEKAASHSCSMYIEIHINHSLFFPVFEEKHRSGVLLNSITYTDLAI